MASDSSCNDINDCRKLFDIIWGYVVTIFACTWISVHPNVPPHCEGTSIALRRCFLMVVAVIAPEMMAGFALRQFIRAKKYSKEYALSLTHGFFISMGGFVTRQGHHPIVEPEQFTEEILADIRATKAQDIEDKSKGDAVSKGLALVQTSWFLVQILTRAIQHLPITGLEISTVAFAVPNLSIMIGPGPEEYEIPETFWRAAPNDPEESTSVPTSWAGTVKWGQTDFVIFVVGSMVACLFGAIHCFSWNFSFPTSTEQMMWRISAAFVALSPSVFPPVLAAHHMLDGRDWQSLRKGLLCIVLFVAIIFVIGSLFYVACRLILLTIAFTTLRSLSQDAYRGIGWTNYLPHM
ncbi:hypothetical protein D9758_007404 [Tetrapyrgos nigripes]|uniref:Uncharacterized protein n=1 Tax=Tetrapyrgos nigripes TaxID=182062 RepID=A0A8H5LHH7_9AGAR|nr:hypothetical protein D9758_007404 [Tetrapyrgos nigripes]